MSDISVLGLGLMGSALARALIRNGHKVTVWNRSVAKVPPLVELGAAEATGIAAALAASPVVIVCVDNYKVTRILFESSEVIPKLAGRIIVQLTTGTPKEARDSETWFASHGAQYLDGGILASPRQIDSRQATVLYSGRRDIFDRCKAYLTAFGEDARFVGEGIGHAAALDLAWLSQCYGNFIGVSHGVALCESEGVDLDLYSAVFSESHGAHYIIDVVKKKSYSNPTATLSVWNAALRRIVEQAGDAGIGGAVPKFVAGILDRAESAGLGEEHIAAMVKVLHHGS